MEVSGPFLFMGELFLQCVIIQFKQTGVRLVRWNVTYTRRTASNFVMKRNANQSLKLSVNNKLRQVFHLILMLVTVSKDLTIYLRKRV